MTDYPASKKSAKKHVWQKQEEARKWRGLLAIFICIFLGFFIVNGILRAFSFRNFIADSEWDGNSSFVAAALAGEPAVLIANRELATIVVLKIPTDATLATGDSLKPLLKVGDIDPADGVRLAKTLTRLVGINIINYIVFENGEGVNEDSAQRAFKNFASLATPVRIITGRPESLLYKTNITRVDLLRLWWQVKGLGIDSLKIMDGGQFLEEVIGPSGGKIKSVERELVHSQIDKYLEIKDFSEANLKVEITNSSGTAGAGQLAGEIAASLGFNVTRVVTGETLIAKCQITGGRQNLRAVSYLANLFGCDILSPSQDDREVKIMLNLGQDFAGRYF